MKKIIRLRFLLKSAFGKVFTLFDKHLAEALVDDSMNPHPEPEFVHIVAGLSNKCPYGENCQCTPPPILLPEVWADFRFSLKEGKS